MCDTTFHFDMRYFDIQHAIKHLLKTPCNVLSAVTSNTNQVEALA